MPKDSASGQKCFRCSDKKRASGDDVQIKQKLKDLSLLLWSGRVPQILTYKESLCRIGQSLLWSVLGVDKMGLFFSRERRHL